MDALLHFCFSCVNAPARVSGLTFSRRSVVVVGGGEIEDYIQSATHRQIWHKGVCVAGQQETFDAGHGEGSILAHNVDSDASALRWGRDSYGGLRLFMVDRKEA